MYTDLVPQVLVQRTECHTLSSHSSASSAEETTQSLCIKFTFSPMQQAVRNETSQPTEHPVAHMSIPPYSNTPIHSTSNRECSVREISKHMYRYQETDRSNIEHKAIAAKRPSPRRQGFPPGCVSPDPADRDYVRGQHTDCDEGKDGVESDGGAGVDH